MTEIKDQVEISSNNITIVVKLEEMIFFGDEMSEPAVIMRDMYIGLRKNILIPMHTMVQIF